MFTSDCLTAQYCVCCVDGLVHVIPADVYRCMNCKHWCVLVSVVFGYSSFTRDCVIEIHCVIGILDCVYSLL